MASYDPNADTIVTDSDVTMIDPEEDQVEMEVRGGNGAEGTSTAGTPAKKKKKEKKYQVFESEEKKLLKKYENLESMANGILDATYKKLFNALSRGNMPEGIIYLKGRLETLKQNVSLDSIYIGFLGPTGAGKTSLLNALFGKKYFLPVSGSTICTSCVVQVKRSRSDQHEALIHLLSEEEWKEEVKTLVEILHNNGDDENEDGDDDDDDGGSDAVEKLRAIYGPGAENKSYDELLKTKLQVAIPAKGTISIKEKEENTFSEELMPYIRVRRKDLRQKESEEKKSKKNDLKHLWPLIKYVEVGIPRSDVVPEGIIFVDIPGVGDINKKRDEMWKQSIDQCSALWIIAATERIDGAKCQVKLLNECIKAYQGAMCTDIIMVVTKSDILDLEEYNRGEREDQTTPIGNEHDAILERNETVKTTMEKLIKEKLKRKLPSDSDIIHKENLVYTVSAKEFRKGEHLNQEETEIPKLRDYIRKLYLKERERLLQDYLKEIQGLLLLAENIGSKEPLVEDHFKESGVEKYVNTAIDKLGKDLEKCFSKMEQPLSDGVKDARKHYENTISKMLTRTGGNKGFHKTLKAVCLKDGVFPSKVFVRIDFNQDLADLIYAKISNTFLGIFRMERGTRGTLWPQLDIFIEDVKQKIHQIAKDRKIPNDSGKIGTFIHEIDVILERLKKEILVKKTVIYQTLQWDIQHSLTPHYKEASKISGKNSCDRMKDILRDSIGREVKNEMFEKAQQEMLNQFTKLKEKIVKSLKKDISTLLKLLLLQEDQLAVKLPDLDRECREIGRLIKEFESYQ